MTARENVLTTAPWSALASGRGVLAAGLATAAEMVAMWCERSRQRRALGALDQRMLKDIGVSQAAAAVEAAKPFWKT